MVIRIRRERPTEKDPRHESMSIIAVLMCFADISKGENVQLGISIAASRGDWEQDGPGHAASNEANDRGDLEETEEQVAIHGMVVQHIAIRDLVERADPIEPSGG
jgi:hypothetical protein